LNVRSLAVLKGRGLLECENTRGNKIFCDFRWSGKTSTINGRSLMSRKLAG